MKKTLLLLLSIALVSGCSLNSGTPINFGAPKFPTTLCAEYDPATSFILKTTSERGIALNEVYYGFLDIAQIGLITEALDREKVKTFMVDVADWYNKNYPVSYTTLLNYMTDEAAKVQGVTAILSRRIGIYQSNLIIGQYDDCLLKAGWNDVMDQLFLR